MRGKNALKLTEALEPYLDYKGVYDIRKSEERRLKLKEINKPQPIWGSRYDLLRYKYIYGEKAAFRLIKALFNRKNK